MESASQPRVEWANPVRRILAVLGGILAAFSVIYGVESIGHTFYPLPEGIDINNPDHLKAYMENIPLGGMLFVLAAWMLGTFLGGLLTVRLLRERPALYASIIGGLVLAGTIANFIMIPHPLWFSMVSVLGIITMTWAASRVAPTG